MTREFPAIVGMEEMGSQPSGPSDRRSTSNRGPKGQDLANRAAPDRGERIEGQTLLERLKTLFPDSSTSSIREWLRVGRVKLNGQMETDGRTLVQPTDRIELGQRAVVAPLRSGASLALPILHRDPHLVIIDKPAGLLSVAAAYEQEQCARALLQQQLRGEVLAVHRLDRETSGVLCFARSAPAQQGLKDLFAAHELTRSYVAVVDGHLEQREGTWECWLWEDPQSYQVRPCEPNRHGAQYAVTHYRVLQEGPARSLLELKLETGRKHQIRVHCAMAGCPVVGDPRYGAPGPRLALHAQLLALQHPIFHEMVSASSPSPAWFRKALHQRI
jgi:23S rRNA pseudouridine1911/1915/1917 synthase